MSVDVTSLVVSVKSDGIKEAATALEALSVAATKVEGKTKTIREATGGLSASQQESAGNIAKLIASYQKQADLLGANTSQQNAYNAAMKGAAPLEQAMAAMLGAEVDAYKSKAAAQAQAIRDNNALDASYKKLQADADAYYASLAKAQAAGNALNVAGTQANEYKKLSAAQAEAIKMNNALDASIRKLNQDEAARKQSLFNNTLQQGHDLARGLSGSLGALWLTYGNIGMMLAGVAIGASLKEAVTGFAKVEYQMTFVKALAEDTTHSVAELTARMHDVAGALGIAPEAAAKGLRALTQAGLNTADALATLPVAFKLATVGELALESAALAATGVMNAYDLKVKDLEHIGDVMAKAGAMSAASVDSISVSMKYSAGTAEQYGVSLEKLGATLTLLGKRGITGSSAGVAANNLIAEIYSPSSEKAIKAAAALGVKAYADGVRQPLEEVIASLKGGLGKFDEQSQGILLEAMFGKKGGKAFYALAQGTKEEFKAMENQLINSSGFVAGVYKANLNTVVGQLNLTKSAITNMFSKVGEESSEPIRDLLVSIRNMASSQAAQDMFVGLTQSIKTFVTTIVPAVAAAGAFFVAVKVGAGVIAAWSAAMVFAESVIAVGLIPAIKALNIAMLSNPIGLVVGLVATLAAGYMLLKRNKESVHDLHKKDMDQAGETLRAGNDEIDMLKRQLSLRKQNIRGDGEQAAIQEMKANESVERIQQRILDNNTKYYAEMGKNKNVGRSDLLRAGQDTGPYENKQLEKDLAEAQKTYKTLADQNKQIQDLRNSKRAEDNRMDAEDAKNAAPKVVGAGKYGGDDKGVAAIARDAYMSKIQVHDDAIRASKQTMQTFEETQNNLYKAGEIGKLKFIQEVGKQKVAELAKQSEEIQAQIDIARNKKNGKTQVQQFTGDLKANEVAIQTAKLQMAEETNTRLAEYEQDATKFKIQQLEIQGKFGEAAALKFSSDNKLAFKQAEQDLRDFGETFPEIENRYIQLQRLAHEAIVDGKNKEALANFNTEADKVRNLLKGVQTASEGQGLAAMFTAAQDASAKYAAELPILKAMMADITNPKGQEEATARMTQNAENYRKLWIGVGDSITKSLKSAFGNGGEAAGKLIKIAQDYNNLSNKSDSARIKSYGDAAGAAKGFFKENTTGYKILETAEKAFRAIELAGMLQSLVMTGTTEAGKQAFKVPTVLMEFMAWMGPWGLAAGAAAIAAIGVSSSGGGGGVDRKARQASQGTGSVLGDTDAKSESIVNSLAILEKNSGLGLAHNNTMIHYLKGVYAGISGLASAVVAKTGISGTSVPGVTEGLKSVFSSVPLIGGILSKLFGTNTTVLDQGFTAKATSLGDAQQNGIAASSYADVNKTKKFLGFTYSDSTSRSMTALSSDVNNQIRLVIDGMAKTVADAANSLGLGGDSFTQRLKSFVVDIGNISVKGLTGTEIEKQFQAVFSKLGDDMAMFALGGLAQYQKANEGLLETVARVANDLIQVKDVFAVLGKTFNLTGMAAISVSESLIEASGGLDKLTTGAKFFVDNFLTEAERMGPISASVTTEMSRLGYGSVSTIEGFSKLVRSLDLTDPASQKLYASLMEVAPAFKEATDYAQDLADGTTKLTKAQQKALDAVNKAKTQLQDSYNSESSALQAVIDKTKTFIGTLKSYQDGLKLGADSPLTNMQKYAEARKQFDATAAAAKGGDQAAKDKFTSAASALLSASRVVNASGSGYTNDFNMVQSAIDVLMTSSVGQVSVAQASLDALNKQVAGLIDINKSVMSVSDAVKALAIAMGASGQGVVANSQTAAVESLYNSLLGRSAEASGMEFWKAAMSNGVSISQVSDAITQSNEYKGLNGGAATYTPTSQQVAAATPSASSANTPTYTMIAPLVAAVEKSTEAINGLRTEQSAQTGALVGATVKSNEDNAETISNTFQQYGNYKIASRSVDLV